MQVIEQQLNGIDNLLYISSTADDSGQATITLTGSKVYDSTATATAERLPPFRSLTI